MKNIVKILGVFLLVLGLVNVPSMNVEATPVNIPDDEFRKCLNNELSRVTGISRADDDVITVAEMNSFTSNVNCAINYDFDIENIEGAQYLTNATYLNLSNGRITDLSPLSGLTNLVNLNLTDNKITDVSALSGLTNLKYLTLRANGELVGYYDMVGGITDLSPLSNLVNLIHLDFSYNTVDNLAFIKDMVNLEYLSGLHNIIDDVNTGVDWSNFPNLSQMVLSHNKITDISGFSGLGNATGLKALSMSNNKIDDISSLSHLSTTSITILYLDYNYNISSVEPLSTVTTLERLGLGTNQISDISSLNNLTNLYYVTLFANDISDISVISNFPDLDYIHLSSNEIGDDNLADVNWTVLSNLRQLALSQNNIHDISTVDWNSLTSLNHIAAGNNHIVDVSPLNGIIGNITNGSFLGQEYTLPSRTVYTSPYQISDADLVIIKDTDGNVITPLAVSNLPTTFTNGETKKLQAWFDDPITIAGGSTISFSGTVYQHVTYVFPLSIDASDFTIHLSDAKDLDELLSKVLANANAEDVSVGLDLSDDIVADAVELASIQSTSVTGVFDLTFTVTHNGNSVSKTIKVTVIDDPVFPLAIDANDFTIHLRDAKDIHDLLSKVLANANAKDIVTGQDLYDYITVNGVELDKIKLTDVIGVFDLTFTVTHNGNSESKIIKVTVINDPVTPTTPNPVLPETGKTTYFIFSTLVVFSLYTIKKRGVFK